LSLIFSLASASTGVRTLIAALNRAYEVQEGRPFWKSQLLALGLTLALCVLVVGGVLIITFGEALITAIGSFIGFAGSVERIFQYIIGLLMLFVGTELIYYFGPNVKQDGRSVIPGTLFAVAAFIVVSYLFSLYVRYAPSYSGCTGAWVRSSS
jgi:membrane protein